MTKARTNGKPVNLKEFIGSTPIHKELAHLAGDNHGSGYNKYSAGAYERDIGCSNYPPPPPPPRYAPYGSDYSHYSGPPGYAAGSYAGLPPPPPPPPPSHGTHQYHRGELYDLPPPPPPGAGQYGHLRANPPPDLAQWEEPIRSYGTPAAYHHQPAGLPHSALYAPYGMPPPPPPAPQISPRTAASNGNGVYDNGYGGYSNGNGVHHSGNGVYADGKGVHSNGNNTSGTITTVVQPDRQPSSGVAKSVANGVKHMEPLVDSKTTTSAKPDSPVQAAATGEAPVTKPTPAVEKVEEEEQEKKSIVTEVPLIADTPLEPTPSTVKNAFAERLAQQALARLASRASGGTVRTDLLQGTRDIAATPAIIVTPTVPDKAEAVAPKVEAQVVDKSTIPVAHASPPPSPRASVVHEPVVNSAVHSPSKESLASKDSVGEDNRPRLKLQPRTLPVDAAAAANAANAGVDDGRRRLQLAPRSKDASGSDPHASKATSIFGAARPREMVLKERGVDAALADLDLAPTKSYGSSIAPHHGYAASSARGSRTASVTSGHSDEHRQGDQWQTVSKGKARNREDSYVPVYYDNDPLLNAFGHTSHSNVPSRFFGEGGSGFLGVRSNDNYRFGSPANTSFTGSYGRNQDTSDGIVIRRSLPLRSDF